MPVGNTLALIAARPGPLQDSLVALMTTMPGISAVLIAENPAAARRTMAQHRPALVVIESGLSTEEGRTAIEDIKAVWPLAKCVVLVDDIDQQQRAQDAGADVALITGYLPATLVAAIEGLLL